MPQKDTKNGILSDMFCRITHSLLIMLNNFLENSVIRMQTEIFIIAADKSGFMWENERHSVSSFGRTALRIAFQANSSLDRNLIMKKQTTDKGNNSQMVYTS